MSRTLAKLSISNTPNLPLQALERIQVNDLVALISFDQHVPNLHPVIARSMSVFPCYFLDKKLLREMISKGTFVSV